MHQAEPTRLEIELCNALETAKDFRHKQFIIWLMSDGNLQKLTAWFLKYCEIVSAAKDAVSTINEHQQ